MAKYHLRNDGLPGECKAQAGNCPLGSDSEHYDDKLDALAAAEEKLREENDYLASSKKNQVFHVGANGAVEECSFRDGYCEVKPFNTMDNVHSSQKSVVRGAAAGFRAAHAQANQQNGGSMPPKPATRIPPLPSSPLPTPSSPTRPSFAKLPEEDIDDVTRQARQAIYDSHDKFDRERLDNGWTPEDIRKHRDSCGHWSPPHARPQRSTLSC